MISNKFRDFSKALFTNSLVFDLNNVFDYFDSKHDYDVFCEFVANYILDDYERANNNVTIICEDGELVQITLFQFLINLYFLEFNFIYKVPVTREWMIDVDKQFFSSYNKHIEEMCQKRIYNIIKKRKMDSMKCFSEILSNLTERMERLAELLSPISAPTLNLVDISEFCNRNSRFNSKLETELDDTKTFSQLEAELVLEGKELKEIIKNDGKSCLVPFVEADCVNEHQLTQMFVAVGPRMSSSNVVMNHIMTKSYLNGLQNAGDLIAESEIASKALIYKKKFVGVSGYMSRETNLAGMNLRIDFDMDDCGTQHYINYNVKDEKHLELIISKNIILPNGKLKEVTADDRELIGTTVKLRSICTCAHHNPQFVCKKCYGNPKDFKRDYTIGGAVSTELQNPLSNAVMSVKHHSNTKTKDFDDPELLIYFNNVENQLILKDIKNSDKVFIVFNKEYIEDINDRIENDLDLVDDDNDEDTDEFGSNIATKMLTDLKVVTRHFDEKTNEESEEVYDVELDGSFLTLSDEMMSVKNIKKIQVPIDEDIAILDISSIKPGTAIFNIKYITADTSRYLKELKNIIERAKPSWYMNLDDPVNDFADLILEAGLKNKELVYLEPIIHALTRDPYDITAHPDFSKKDVELIVINLSTAIFKGDLCSALIFQELTKILKDKDSFTKNPKVGHGLHDTLFRTSIKHDFTYFKKALKKAKII